MHLVDVNEEWPIQVGALKPAAHFLGVWTRAIVAPVDYQLFSDHNVSIPSVE